MAAIFLSWIIGLTVFFAFGHFFIRLFKFHEKNIYNFADVFFLGLSAVGTILAILSLWIPLTGYVLISLFTLSLIYLGYNYRKGQLSLLTNTLLKLKNLSLAYKIALALFVIVLAFYCLLPPGHFDSGLYHWQGMMWVESYPVIPGLGNILERLGFNSNALLLHSAFSLQDILGFHVIGLNGLVLVILFSWIILKIRESGLIPQLALILFVFLILRFHDVYIASPITDWMPNIIISYLLLRAVFDYHSPKTVPLLYWVLPVFCLTLKISVAPFCLFSLIVFIGLLRNKQYKTILTSIIIACVILIPWFARNVIISGYLVYPYPAIDLFNVDWKVPASVAEAEQNLIKSWARVHSSDVETILNMPLTEWGKLWVVRFIEYSKTALLMCGLAAISPFIILFTQKRKLLKKPYKIYPWLIAFIGTIFWFIMAPDVRFGFGYITFMAVVPFLLIDSKTENTFLKKAPIILIFLFLLFFARMSLTTVKNTVGDRTYFSFLYKPNTMDYIAKQTAVEYVPYELNDIIIYVPISGTQCCYNHEIPCVDPALCLDCLELRGKSIKDGFRVKKTVIQEKDK
jgi:hypothetical protein